MNELKNAIIYALINKNEEAMDMNIEQREYVASTIYPLLAEKEDSDLLIEVITYIEKCLQSYCERNKINLTDTNILRILSPSWATKMAYDYLIFKQNEHEDTFEYSHWAR